MLGVIFLTLFAFAGKALLQKVLQIKQLKRKANFDLSSQRYRVRSVTPIPHVQSPRESMAEPEDLVPHGFSESNRPGKNVTFETEATTGKQGSVKTTITESQEQETVR